MQQDDQLALSFKALSHPRRTRIFRILALNPEAGRSFLTLLQASKMAQSSFVHHIRVMESCGLVSRRRKRGNVEYNLTPGALHMALLEAGRLGKTRSIPRANAA